MPSLSKRNKRGGKKRFNFVREGKKAETYLRQQSSEKFAQSTYFDCGVTNW